MENLQEQEVHVALWGDVTAPELANLREKLKSQYLRCGRPLVYVGVVPDNAPLPSADARKEMAQAMREAAGMCEYMCIIFQGEGFKASAKRTAFSGMLMMVMKGKWQVAGRIDELIGKAGGDLRRVDQLKRAAKLAAERGWKL